jgi:hypothetical protein
MNEKFLERLRNISTASMSIAGGYVIVLKYLFDATLERELSLLGSVSPS